MGYRENLGLIMSLKESSTTNDDFLRFSTLNNEQIIFIMDFLKCFRETANEKFFDDSYNDDIELAINFLQNLEGDI